MLDSVLVECNAHSFHLVPAAFEKLGLDCANWNEPVYSDLLRCVSVSVCVCVFFWLYLLDCSLAFYACVLNVERDGTLLHEFMSINALNFIEASLGHSLHLLDRFQY